MLKNLHVKNLALIEEEDIDFTTGLNILSGETGAGKSIILGALGLALGEKAPKGLIKDANEDAVVEAVFSVDSSEVRDALAAMSIEVFDDEVILSRRISPSKATAKINGDAVPANKLSEAGRLFIDIYGQHEHQSLLSKKKHAELLDEFCKDDLGTLKDDMSHAVKDYKKSLSTYENALKENADRESMLGLLEFEYNTLSEAKLVIGEDEELEREYRILSSYSKLMDSVGAAYSDISGSASDMIGRAITALRSVENLDERVANASSALADAESIVSDVSRELSDILNADDYSEEKFNAVETRLNLINNLKHRFNKNSIEDLIKTMEEKQSKIDALNDYDTYVANLKINVDEQFEKCNKLAEKISDVRVKASKLLASAMETAMAELNFLQSKFEVKIERMDAFNEDGFDDIEFMVSTNPGQPVASLIKIASGGEMSRIMLAIKTVLASKDMIDTLIFDEIDAGISGKTASYVAARLASVAKEHQVICITHLAQIAACADSHFLIEKSVIGQDTVSGIKRLSEEDSVKEIARMISGEEITDASLANAKELRDKAKG